MDFTSLHYSFIEHAVDAGLVDKISSDSGGLTQTRAGPINKTGSECPRTVRLVTLVLP